MGVREFEATCCMLTADPISATPVDRGARRDKRGCVVLAARSLFAQTTRARGLWGELALRTWTLRV